MKVHTLFYLSLIIILFGACASVGTSLGPSYGDWNKDEHRQYVKVTFTNTHAFSPSTTTTMMLECRDLRGILGRHNKSDEEILRDSQCRPADVGRHDVGAGVVAGFGSAVVQSAGIVGSAYLIGEGLKKSGDTYSTENNLTDSSENNLTDDSWTSNNNQRMEANSPNVNIDINADANAGNSETNTTLTTTGTGDLEFNY